jgi:hypothetical protein
MTKYNYICNNSGCPPRASGCPIPSKSTEPTKCIFCGYQMIEIVRCKCGDEIPFNAKYCGKCGEKIENAPELEAKTQFKIIQID